MDKKKMELSSTTTGKKKSTKIEQTNHFADEIQKNKK